TGGAQIVHYFNYLFVARAGIGPEEDRLVQLIDDQIFNLGRQLIGRNLIFVQITLAVARYRDGYRVALVGGLHRNWILRFHHIHADALRQHRGDDHEDDEHHEHHVHHGSYVDIGYWRRRFLFLHDFFSIEPGFSFRRPLGRAPAFNSPDPYYALWLTPATYGRRRAATALRSSRSARNWNSPSPRRRLRSCQ